MNTYKNQLDEILYNSLRPWLSEDLENEEYTAINSKLTDVELNFESSYRIDYYRALSAKHTYYNKLIINGINAYCNRVYELVAEDDNLLRMQHVYNGIMKNELPERFTDIMEVIKEKEYFIEHVNPKQLNFEVNLGHQSDAYVMQFLKIAYVKVYLEIQEQFKHLSTEMLLTADDVYDQLLNQPPPVKPFIIKTISTPYDGIDKLFEASSDEKKTGISMDSLTYKNFDLGSDKLSDLFKFLKENELLAKGNMLANFKTVFSGREVGSSVIWGGTSSDFAYFVSLLNKFELIEPLKRRMWKVASKCFVQSDGCLFDIKKLKLEEKPKDKMQLIEDAVDLLK